MGMREDFEQWHNSFYGPQDKFNPIRSLEMYPDEIGLGYIDPTVQAQFVAYQAATLQAAERMKEEAAKVCESDESGRDANGYYANEIRAIDVNKLFGE